MPERVEAAPSEGQAMDQEHAAQFVLNQLASS
jgi:hypothetical protein